jgi:hypothetical protein
MFARGVKRRPQRLKKGQPRARPGLIKETTNTAKEYYFSNVIFFEEWKSPALIR